MRNAEFEQRIICGTFRIKIAANYTLFEFRIPQNTPTPTLNPIRPMTPPYPKRPMKRRNLCAHYSSRLTGVRSVVICGQAHCSHCGHFLVRPPFLPFRGLPFYPLIHSFFPSYLFPISPTPHFPVSLPSCLSIGRLLYLPCPLSPGGGPGSAVSCSSNLEHIMYSNSSATRWSWIHQGHWPRSQLQAFRAFAA